MSNLKHLIVCAFEKCLKSHNLVPFNLISIVLILVVTTTGRFTNITVDSVSSGYYGILYRVDEILNKPLKKFKLTTPLIVSI